MTYEIPFSLPIHVQLDESRLALLVAELGMRTQVQPKQERSIPFAMAQLDPYTGLYLLRGKAKCQWTLECRAYCPPPSACLRHWYIHAAWVASQLNGGTAPHRMPQEDLVEALSSRSARRAVADESAGAADEHLPTG